MSWSALSCRVTFSLAPTHCVESTVLLVSSRHDAMSCVAMSLCRKPPSFHKCSSWVLFLRNAWFDCDSSWVLLSVFPTFTWYSLLEVDFVLLSGGSGRARRRQQQRYVLVLLVTLPLVLCSLQLTAGLAYGEVCTVDASVAVFA